jgi:hypothetical protein
MVLFPKSWVALNDLSFPVEEDLELEGKWASRSGKFHGRPTELGLGIGDLGSAGVVQHVQTYPRRDLQGTLRRSGPAHPLCGTGLHPPKKPGPRRQRLLEPPSKGPHNRIPQEDPLEE